MEKKTKKIKCSRCDNEASFFHSRCCNAHFEGVIEDGRAFIVCEKCGKPVGEVTPMKFKK